MLQVEITHCLGCFSSRQCQAAGKIPSWHRSDETTAIGGSSADDMLCTRSVDKAPIFFN